jgi:hypothetical protein
MDIRWSETWKLANWAMQRLKTIDKFYNQKSDKMKGNDNNNSESDDKMKHKRLLNRIRHL